MDVWTDEVASWIMYRVKLLQLPGKPFSHPVALVTLFFVAVTAILQIICLNKGLKAADSTLIVPLFYAGYTVLG